jgi:transposase InsO family protein
MFGFVRDLVLRFKNERHKDAIRAICNDNGSEFRNSRFETFCHDLGLEHQFLRTYTPPLSEWHGGKEKQNLVRDGSDDAR